MYVNTEFKSLFYKGEKYMRKKHRTILAFFLTLVMLLSNTVSSLAKNTNELTRTNYNFICIDDSGYYEYTYKENGTTYKIIEYLTENYKKLDTYIYEVNNDNTLKLHDHFITNIVIDNGKITCSEIRNDKEIVVAVIPVDKLVHSDINTDKSVRATNVWLHIANYSGGVEFTKFTIGLVVATLAGAIGYLAGNIYAAGAVSGAHFIATAIVERAIPYVYLKQKMYYFYPDTSTAIPTRYRAETECFEELDKNGNPQKSLGTTVHEGDILLGGN